MDTVLNVVCCNILIFRERYNVGEFLWWADQGDGRRNHSSIFGGGSALQVDYIHCNVTVPMVAIRLYVLDRAVEIK